MNDTDPVDDLLNKFSTHLSDESGDLPQMPFISNYDLTKEQETNLVDFALQRIDDLEYEMGRQYVSSGDWWDQDFDIDGEDGEKSSPERTWMGKRRLYELIYQNNMDWRENVIGGIFEHTNLVVPVARRVARQMTARANLYYFGSDPWFATYAVGQEDEDVARKGDKYLKYKAKEAKLRGILETSVNKAFVLGERVLKTSHSVIEQAYKRKEVVLIGPEGEPIIAGDGDYITEEDKWGEDGNLIRDGITPRPLDEIYEERLINRRLRTYHGPSTEGISFTDFLCPLSAKSVQKADCCAHLYDMSMSELIDGWAKRGAIDLNAVEHEEVTLRAIEVLRKISGGEDADHGDTQRSALGETQHGVKTNGSMVELAEIYLRYDANGDGIMEDIVLLVDRKNRVPLFYDYVANITPDGLRPFSVVKINKELDYWHGQGCIEMFEENQKIMDLLVNRWEFSQTSSGRVTFWNPSNTEEGAANPNLQLNTGQTYTPRPGVKIEEILQSISLYDTKGQDIKQFLEFFMQITMNESGVQHANDSSMAGLDSQKLATGIRNVEKTGQEMFSVFISDLESGLVDTLDKFKDCLYENLDKNEVVTYFEGEAKDIIEIAASEVADLDLHMNLVMTRQHGLEVLESNRQASELVTAYYTQLPPEVQTVVAPFYHEMLRALKIKNVESIIQPLGQPTGGQVPQTDPNMGDAVAPAEREVEPNY